MRHRLRAGLLLALLLPAAAQAAHSRHNRPGAAVLVSSSPEETSYWNSVKNSPYGADLQGYLQAYPHGAFAGLAQTRIRTLARTGVVPPQQDPLPTPNLSGKNEKWKQDPRANCWVYDPYGTKVHITLADVLPAFLSKPVDQNGVPQNATIFDLLPGIISKKLNGESIPGEAKPAWSGPCENQLANGEGTLAWSDGGKAGDSLKGAFHGGVLNGHGSRTSPDGSYYEGNFDNSVPAGHGFFRSAEGATYDGEWANGLFNGHGVSTNSVGTYDGQFRDGVQNGRGVFTLVDRDKVEGNWTNGLRDPACVYTFSDGARYVGDIPGEGRLTTPDGQQHPASASQDEQGAVNIDLGG